MSDAAWAFLGDDFAGAPDTWVTDAQTRADLLEVVRFGGEVPTDPGVPLTLEDALWASVNARIPNSGVGELRAWLVLQMPQQPRAPTIWVSRDPRLLDRLTPVLFFRGLDDDATSRIGALVRVNVLGYIRQDYELESPSGRFHVIPAAFQLDDPDRFVHVASSVMDSIRRLGPPVAWAIERCKVIAFPDGVTGVWQTFGPAGSIVHREAGAAEILSRMVDVPPHFPNLLSDTSNRTRR
jgi:hypothetical protein